MRECCSRRDADVVGRAKLPLELPVSFDFRDTHEPPAMLPVPSQEWLGPYDRLVNEEALAWPTLEELHSVAAAIMDPILVGTTGTWPAAGKPMARALSPSPLSLSHRTGGRWDRL